MSQQRQLEGNGWGRVLFVDTVGDLAPIGGTTEPLELGELERVVPGAASDIKNAADRTSRGNAA